jgi:lipoprotein NlpD
MTGNKSGELLGVGLRALALSAALLLALPAATAISGCSSTNSYQVEDRSTGGRSRPQSAGKPGKNQYRVQKGDTLYSVAQKIGYRFDYHYLAKKNGIKPPYAIEKGQILNISDDCGGCRVHVVKSGETLYSTAFLYHTTVGKLAALNGFSVQTKLNAGQNIIVSEGKSSAWPSAKPGKTGTGSAAGTGKGSSAGSSKPVRTADDTPAPVASRSGISWRWPASGKVVRGFSVAENGNKGIDIAGKRGAPVKAAAAGTVVYAGNALRGYGNLIIIKHSDDYLSAYAHNDSIKVKEQQKVKAGQLIAGMGSTDADRVALHFEIRYRGKSQNPSSYLPKSRN